MEIINEANDKFKDMQEGICGLLFDILRRINAVEKDIFDRNEAIEAGKPSLGIPKNQIAPGEKELWGEYKERLYQIIAPVCTEKLIGKRYGGSFGSPQKYDYIDGECKINFIMKSSKTAVIETHYRHGIDSKHKFVIRNIDGKWLIDEVYYGFENDGNTWYSDSIG